MRACECVRAHATAPRLVVPAGTTTATTRCMCDATQCCRARTPPAPSRWSAPPHLSSSRPPRARACTAAAASAAHAAAQLASFRFGAHSPRLDPPCPSPANVSCCCSLGFQADGYYPDCPTGGPDTYHAFQAPVNGSVTAVVCAAFRVHLTLFNTTLAPQACVEGSQDANVLSQNFLAPNNLTADDLCWQNNVGPGLRQAAPTRMRTCRARRLASPPSISCHPAQRLHASCDPGEAPCRPTHPLARLHAPSDPTHCPPPLHPHHAHPQDGRGGW